MTTTAPKPTPPSPPPSTPPSAPPSTPPNDRNVTLASTLLSPTPSSPLTLLPSPSTGGITAITNNPLSRGDLILQSYAAGIAIDPPHRHLRCGFCAQRCDGPGTICPRCPLVAICSNCRCVGVDEWHERSGECAALESLSLAFRSVFDDGGEEVETCHVLTVRLLARRWYEENKSGGDGDDVLPVVNWKLFDQLHRAKVASSASEQDYYDRAMSALCEEMRDLFVKRMGKGESSSRNDDGSWMTKDKYDVVMGMVSGCAHAITDVSEELGAQVIGGCLATEHSFYDHECAPVAFFSCCFEEETTRRKRKKHVPALLSKVHCLTDLKEGDNVTLSYISSSGLSREERRARLQEGYRFDCACRACALTDKQTQQWEQLLKLPPGSDLDALRDVQHGCYRTLLTIKKEQRQQTITTTSNDNISSSHDELQRCLVLIKMCQTGIQNQNLPPHHEIAIEIHRLYALAYSLLGDFSHAVTAHQRYLEAVNPVRCLFDPVARGTQLLALGRDRERLERRGEGVRDLTMAVEELRVALGVNHLFVKSAQDMLKRLQQTYNEEEGL